MMTVLQTMWDKAVIVRIRARRVFVLGTVLASLLLVALPRAHAVDPERHISQYGHTAWRIRDGFFEGVPYAIKQTADGYLWIGGANGLVRFDGVRFVPFTPPPGRQLPAPVIGRILAARDGSLWIGTMRGLSHWTNKDLINYPSTANAITAPFVEDEDGTIWFWRAAIADDTGPLCQVKDTVIRCYGKADGIPEEAYANVVRDSAGNFWLGSSNTLTRWRPGSFQTYYLSGLKANAGAGLFALAPRPDGLLWVGMADSGPAMGLQQLSHGAWKPFVVPGFDSSTLKVQTLFVDNQNALWVGTFEHGVYRIHGQGIEHFDSSEGLSGDAVFAFFEDREGNLWVATDKGLDCFRDLPVISLSTREGLTTPSVSTVQAMRDGSIWIGGAYALNILGPGLGQGRVRSLQTGKGLPGDQVTSLFEDHAGRHWVGIENTLNIYENGRFTRITRRDGSPMGMVLGITEDVDNNLWVLSLGPPRMLIRIFNRKVQEVIPTPQIPGASSIVADPRGGVWLGLLNGDLARYQQGRVETFRFEHPPDSRVHQVLLSADGSVLGATTYGLIGWSNGKQQTLSARNGLPCDGVYSAVKDDSDVLWLYMQCGLVEIARSDLQRWWEEPDVKLQPRVFDVFDGFQGGNRAAFESKAVRTVDGRLWFANAFVAQTIDPAHLARNLIAPAVHVEQVIADRKSHSLQGEVRLPALTRDLEIDYTALSFVVPQKVQFQYKLEGYDRDWQDAGTRRQAFYSNLPPRNYTFRVKACNNSGLWNETGVSLDFFVAPAFYQTRWFQAACVAAFVVLLWILYRMRLRQVAQQFNMRLEERVNERTRIARDLHDTLLQSFHGLLLRFQTAYDLFPTRPDEAQKTLGSAIDQTAQAITEGRDAVQGLRSSTVVTNDLAQAINTLGEELAAGETNPNSTVFHVGVEGTTRDLHPKLRDEVYRIAGEGMRNAFKHAQAQRIEVELRYDERQFRLRVRDDGKGIDAKLLNEDERPGHYGLRGMRERAKLLGGKLTVWSELDSGTEVELSIPAANAYATADGRRRSWLAEKFARKLVEKDTERKS